MDESKVIDLVFDKLYEKQQNLQTLKFRRKTRLRSFSSCLTEDNGSESTEISMCKNTDRTRSLPIYSSERNFAINPDRSQSCVTHYSGEIFSNLTDQNAELCKSMYTWSFIDNSIICSFSFQPYINIFSISHL